MRPTGSIRQRSDGTFEIRYGLGTDPLTGSRKRIHKTVGGKYEDAKKVLRKILNTIDDNQHVEPTKIKTGEFLAQWLETVRSRVSPKTHERYSDIVRRSLTPNLGNCLLTQLTPSIIQGAYNKLEATVRKDKRGNLSPRTRLIIHRVFKSALKHAVQLQLLARNPAEGVIPPRAKKATIKTLTVEQSVALLHALKGTRLYWPVLLALTTGMRRGEILALRWKNVDFGRMTARVVESLEHTRQGLRFKAPKTEKTRAITLPQYAVEELRMWKENQAKELEAYDANQTEESLVCGKRDGGVLNPTTLTHEFIIAINHLNALPRVRFHDLRHTHATQLMAAGIHPKIAQERLGHSTITTTLDLYSHVTDTMQTDAASKLDSALRFAIKVKSDLIPKPG